MRSPFVFGKPAKGRSFINRKIELKHLTDNFNSGTHTIITSPRRWGKSSLVYRAAEQVSGNNELMRVCRLDLFSIQDEHQFYKAFALAVLDASQDLSIKISWEDLKQDVKTIIDLPEKIALKTNAKFVIVIDEFQKVAHFKASKSLLKKLHSHWKGHSQTCYCLCLSNRQISNRLFATKGQPFYGFGNLVMLQKIKSKHWYGYIEEQFTASGKSISREIIDQVIDVTGKHPYYIQQLCHYLWRLTLKSVSQKIFDTSLHELVLLNDILFRKELESLTPLQIRYLIAMVNREPHLSSMKTINKYKLGSPGNLSTIKAALETKEIVDFYDTEPVFINPFFEYWLRNVKYPV